MLVRSTDAISADEVRPWRLDKRVARALVAIMLADLCLLGVGMLIGAHPYLLLATHITLVLVLAFRLGPRGPGDLLEWQLAVTLLLVAGPVGGIGALWLGGFVDLAQFDRSRLAQWHGVLAGEARIEDAQLLHEAILAGREFRPKSDPGRRFSEILECGTLAEKQALLGHIGLNYHADYFPLLDMALRSPEAGVRAQAAAVFVKLKEGFRHRLRDAGETAIRARSQGDGRAMLAAASAMLACAGSGFLDTAEAREAGSSAGAVCTAAVEFGADAIEADILMCRVVAATGGGEAIIARLMDTLPALTATVREELARCLVVAGRHADLNRLLTAYGPLRRVVPATATLPQPPQLEGWR
jgi:hypothetical protein